MKKMSATTTLALLLALILGSTVAYAHLCWCPDDPVLLIDGHEVHVIVEIPEGSQALVNGPVKVEVRVPKDVDASITSYGDSFGHGPEEVTIKRQGKVQDDDEIKIQVKAKVSATEKFPVRVTIDIPNPGASESKEGRSNKWVKCKVELGDD